MLDTMKAKHRRQANEPEQHLSPSIAPMVMVVGVGCGGGWAYTCVYQQWLLFGRWNEAGDSRLDEARARVHTHTRSRAHR